jgi:hypothetical protein
MLSPCHEIPVVFLAGEPWLLSALAQKLLGKALPGALVRDDSTVRFGNAREIRPDLVFTATDCAEWVALEVQLRPDPRKVHGWPVLVSVLQYEHDTMGDLVILTSSRHVARWARGTCRSLGRLGTRQRVRPTVLWVSSGKVHRLLDPANPRLAFFAAWAMRKRYSPRAQRVVQEALRITDLLPEPLRRSQKQAIFGVLNQRLRSKLKENTMAIDESKLPPLPDWYVELERKRKAREEAWEQVRGELKGRREALFTIFKVRGLTPLPKQQAQIHNCLDAPTLDRWIARAVDASSVKDVLGSKPLRGRRPLAAGAQPS